MSLRPTALAVEEVLTTAAALEEVQEYLSDLARKKRLPLDTVLLAAATLPVVTVEQDVYSAEIPEASRRIGWRDADDVELLALALHLDVPVWSNDRDFEHTGVTWYNRAAPEPPWDQPRQDMSPNSEWHFPAL